MVLKRSEFKGALIERMKEREREGVCVRVSRF